MSETADSPATKAAAFEEDAPRAMPPTDSETLNVDLDGFEGPLDLLLMLARDQKVDLAKISILELAEQYLAFIAEARRLALDLAADYLVMAAWLAYLKSKLLLPPPEEEEGPSGEEMAARLAFRLKRLEAMRKAAEELMQRPQTNVHMFPRGRPEGIRVRRSSTYTAALYDLLTAYAEERTRTHLANWRPKQLPILPLEQARKRLETMVGMMVEWNQIGAYLPPELKSPELKRSALASMLFAALELAREGGIEVQQQEAFAPLFLRRKVVAAAV